VPIDSFWFDAAHLGEFHYDTRAAYDAANDRWTLVTLGDTNLAHGYLLVATAKGDPTGTWRRFRVALGGAKADGDFTRLALTASSVLVTLRLYDGESFTGCDVYELAKTDLYAGGSVIPAALHFHVSTDDLTPIATSDPSDDRTRFVSGKNADIADYDGANFVSSTSYVAPLGFDTPRETAGAQLGTPQLMDTGEMIFHYALVRNGVTWIVRSIEPRSSTSTHTSILLWRIDPAGPAATYLIDDPTGKASYAFPSLAVNKFGAVLVAYAYFSPDVYPSSAATYIDAAGTVVGTSFLKKGVAPYLINRWGDYTTTVVDPADDTSFWSLTLYRGSTVPSVQQWAAWWSYITAGPPKPHAVRR
jgi:hypothetical protein